jgi:pseudouridine-5'-phosphate glycosidase
MIPDLMMYSPAVGQAIKAGVPVVALESAVITHGFPRPDNWTLAKDLEEEVTSGGAVPATIALLDGKIHIGLTPEELEKVATDADAVKISRRDIPTALSAQKTGGTTVAASIWIAHAAGLKVFSTGGIGGVHRGSTIDISADLPELARTPLIVVCSGAKAILDLPSTLEYLETVGVAVIGYQTDEFPAFYSRESGLPVSGRADSPGEIIRIARIQWKLGFQSAILVAQPPPADAALPRQDVEKAVHQALEDAAREGVTGAKVTPFLLKRVNELTGGFSKRTNTALIVQNARLATQIAVELGGRTRPLNI